jgi:hypothetical protein
VWVNVADYRKNTTEDRNEVSLRKVLRWSRVEYSILSQEVSLFAAE